MYINRIVFILSGLIHIYLKNWLWAILSFLVLIIVYLFYSLTKKRKIAGPIIGIILGSIYVVSFMWTRQALSVAIGIAVIADSIAMLKYIKML